MISVQDLEFKELVNKYEALINQFIRKYRSICEKYQIDSDELRQLCLIGLWKAQEKFDDTKGTSFTTYTYNQIEYSIKNRLREVKEADKNCISLQLLASQDDDTTTLQDILQDPVNIADTVEDNLMMLFYKNEIRCKLNEDEAEAVIDKAFNECIGVDYKLIKKARKNLIRKSFIFREEFRKIKHLPDTITIY